MTIDDKNIESLVSGYRIIAISGRESLNYSVTDKDRPLGIDGMLYFGKRQPSRTITVKFSLQADTLDDLVSRYNELKGLCQGDNRKIQFSDKPNSYYIGTLITIKEDDSDDMGQLFTVGEMTFYCPDPHKHSTVTKTFTAAENADGILEATINNEGTASVPVNYNITHNHDNGYIGIVSEEGVMQFGKVDDVDGETYQGNEVLIQTQDFSGFTADTGENVENTKKTTDGTLSVKTVNGVSCLGLNTPGSGSYFHGGMWSMDIPEDSHGVAGATNFLCNFMIWFEPSNVNQMGTISINFLDENDELICSYIVEKGTAWANTAMVHIRGGQSGEPVGDIGRAKSLLYTSFIPSSDNSNQFSFGMGAVDMKKEGGTISAFFSGTRVSMYAPELANVACKKIQIFIGKYADSPMVDKCYFRLVSFQKMNVDKWRDVPNRYPNGSNVVIDGNESKIYVDKIVQMGDEIKGTQYFLVPPGETKIQFYHSDFSDPAPDIVAEIREAWL